MSEPALTIHVERTAVTDVLRWVCHRPDLDHTPAPPPDSALGQMVGNGVIDLLAVQSGDLIIRFRHPDDPDHPDTLAAVHRAVTEALRDDHWSTPTGLASVTIRTRQRQGT